jgi:hypothetical protein
MKSIIFNMKKILLFLLLFVLMYGQIKAQKYIPLLDTGKIWIDQFYFDVDSEGTYNPSGPMKYWLTNSQFKIIGDTLLKNIDSNIIYTYKKIYIQENQNSIWKLGGFLREDTILRKVYAFDKINSVDGLIYDFALKSNEVTNLCNTFNYTWGSFSPYQVLSTDSIVINGKKRLRIIFYNDVWIEGIGSLLGLTNTAHLLSTSTPVLLCYLENNKQVYHNSSFTDCFYTYGSTTDIAEIIGRSKGCALYDIQKQVLNIHFESNNGCISIYDTYGRTQISNVNLDYSSEIDCSKLSNGIYFYSISDIHQKIITGTFIKQ